MLDTDFPVILTGFVEPAPEMSVQMDGATHRLMMPSSYVRLRPGFDPDDPQATPESVLEDLKAVADGSTVVVIVGHYVQVEGLTLVVHKVARVIEVGGGIGVMLDSGGDAFPWAAFKTVSARGDDDWHPC